MATAQTIVNRALRLIGAIASGESPTTAESDDALVALNAMIESWQTEKLHVYTLVDTAYTASVGDGSYTVGPSANFALTPRPPSLDGVFARVSSIDYPIDLVSEDRWFAIPDKTSRSDIPRFAYYEPTIATGTLLVWPVPSASISIHIVTGTPLGTLATLGTTVSVPQGGERALAYNLAVDIAPEYPGHKDITEVIRIATEAKAAIKRANQRSMKTYTELSGMFTRRSDIFSGGYLT